MTKQDLRLRLFRYRDLQAEAEQIHQALERVEARMGAPRASQIDGMPRSHGYGSDPAFEIIAQHIALENRYKAQLARLTAEMTWIEDTIEGLDPMERTLMRHRYLEGKTWEEVCVAIGYSWRQTHNIHARILNKLVNQYDEGQGD